MTKPILLVVGTRAEAIKLVPLYLALKKSSFHTLLCATCQHREMLEQVFTIFNVKPDFNLNVMKENQDLFYLTQIILEKTKQVYLETNPALVIVHGDTTTTMAAALSAFYLHIPIAHVEAGLRTGNIQTPFPEEMNRKIVGQIASYHFAPTAFSTANLLAEGIKREHIFCTGNTIIDALNIIKSKIETNQISISKNIKTLIQTSTQNHKKIILLTAHRRESFGGGLQRIFSSIKSFAQLHDDTVIIFPVHPNPNVQKAVQEANLKQQANIILIPPLDYADLIYTLGNVNWVATDSGGIQEEATGLGKRVLVLRDITERWEGVWEEIEILVGTNPELITHHMEKLYAMDNTHIEPSTTYGDGKACARIVSILKTTLHKTMHDQKIALPTTPHYEQKRISP